MTILQKILKFIAAVITIIYPFAVFFALKRQFSVQFMVLILLTGVIAAFLRHGRKTILFVGVILCTAMYVFADTFFLKIYPVLMNALVCTLFACSLKEKPLITVFAEKMHYVLDEDGIKYTRKVTLAWAVFMAVNTVLSLISVFMSDCLWALYNGFISYILIGAMMLGEYIIRKRKKNAD